MLNVLAVTAAAVAVVVAVALVVVATMITENLCFTKTNRRFERKS